MNMKNRIYDRNLKYMNRKFENITALSIYTSIYQSIYLADECWNRKYPIFPLDIV